VHERHGTTTLFAALRLLDGRVIGDCMPRHRHQEFIRFLRQVAAAASALPSPLHAHVEFLAEPGGALVPR